MHGVWVCPQANAPIRLGGDDADGPAVHVVNWGLDHDQIEKATIRIKIGDTVRCVASSCSVCVCARACVCVCVRVCV